MRSRRSLAISLATLLSAALLAGCGSGQPEPTTSPAPRIESTDGSDAELYAAELVELTNEARAAEGLEPLEESTCARTAGLERAAALVGQEELVHAPLTPVIADCAPLTTAAENLVNSSAGAADVLDAWLGSPGHRANIVDPALTEIGIGCVPDGAKLLCSQIFLGP